MDGEGSLFFGEISCYEFHSVEKLFWVSEKGMIEG